jgi:hypothetical protein
MKRSIVVLAAFASFGANSQSLNAQINNGIKGIFSDLQAGGSQTSRIAKMQEAATVKINAGETPTNACSVAFAEADAGKPSGNERRSKASDDRIIDQCVTTADDLPVVQQARAKREQAAIDAWDSDAPNRERVGAENAARAKAEELVSYNKAAADQSAAQQALIEIRSGRRQPQGFEEAATAYDAQDGSRFASAPRIRPDGKSYFLTGNVDQPDGETPSFVARDKLQEFQLRQLNVRPDAKYFAVSVPKRLEAQYFDAAKVGAFFKIVGVYKGNRQYVTVDQQQKLMPVFEAQYLDFAPN